MLIVLFFIFLSMIVLGCFFIKKGGECESYSVEERTVMTGIIITILAGVLELIVVLAITFCSMDVSEIPIMDSKIAMYEQENNNIQSSISEIVENYMNYESGTYANSVEKIDLKDLDMMMATQIYPELKANELVMRQMDVYTANNDKIRQLKEEKLNNQVSKWWLYFGKADV